MKISSLLFLFCIFFNNITELKQNNSNPSLNNFSFKCSYKDKNLNKFKEYILFDNNLKIKIPSSFSPMAKKYAKLKYPTVNHNIAKVFSNNAGTISVLLELSKRALKSSQLPYVKSQIENSFKNIPEINLKQVNIKKINNKNFVVVEFISEALDSRLYNLMFITNIDGKTFTGTFNCTVDHLTKWKPKAKEILNSVIIE